MLEHQRAGCSQQTAASVTARDGASVSTTETRTSDNLDVDRVCDRPRALELNLDAPHDSRVRAGDTIRHWIEVRNASRRDLLHIRLCHRLPSGLVYAGSHRGARLVRGELCWAGERVDAGADPVVDNYPLRARVDKVSCR